VAGSGLGGMGAGITFREEGITGDILDWVGAAGVGGTKMFTKVWVPEDY